MSAIGRRFEIRGTVQGVGFRPWVYRLAIDAGIGGRVRNDAGGVTIEAFGPRAAVDSFARQLATGRPPAAEIHDLRSTAIPAEPDAAFRIVPSAAADGVRISIPADLATCPDCLADIADPSNRRYRYPFTNCTNCGPRFTIARAAPYDRAATTMAPFEMCAACRAEYEDPADRRFHAEPNACPACGPRLSLVTPDGVVLTVEDPIDVVGAALAAGGIVAIKGLGGFHLACDATNGDAVARLRERKRRDARPFAVMVRDLVEAGRVAVVADVGRELLASSARPIVLAPRRDGGGIAAAVAPDCALAGILLPYTPLHHLLMARAAGPLVMTSGNLSDEPLATGNAEALARLGGLADLFLLHDRDIDTGCDDSVCRVVRGAPVVLRRSRGYVPRPIPVSPRFRQPVLACGALLKNTFCIGLDDAAYLGPHVGDLANLSALQSFTDGIERLERFLRVAPEIVAYDLHPDYLSTRYALDRPAAERVGVQHHHAHVVSAMAEHDLHGPVVGVAYDGTGYGPDGAAWGGEVLIANRATYERVAALRAIPLAGGDQAIRQPWRIALALLDDAFDGQPPPEALRFAAALPAQQVEAVRKMIAGRIQAPLAHGAGRYFDGVAALVIGRTECRYEGQLALEWNGVAEPAEDGVYGFSIDRGPSPWTIDLRPMVRAIVRDRLAAIAIPIVSARFHNTLAAATAEAVRLVSAQAHHRRLPVILTGGCFQNPRLAESVAERLAGRFSVLLHQHVPPGDGGIALGQAIVADTISRGHAPCA